MQKKKSRRLFQLLKGWQTKMDDYLEKIKEGEENLKKKHYISAIQSFMQLKHILT